MGFFKNLLISLGVIERPKVIRKKENNRRRVSRRWTRTSEYKDSPEYKARMRRDRRRAERRKTL